ncbi:MAG: radical SAM protein [Methanobacteriaceae archaeon]|jgi:DNA repair photolyase|nr:radical SAM protein [Methanobacteriaceae archaeon]
MKRFIFIKIHTKFLRILGDKIFLNTSKICKKYNFREKRVKSIFNPRKGKRNLNLFLEDYTINPYLGCSFDCVYCYINGSKYAKETNNFYVKSNARELVHKFLKRKFYDNEKAMLNLGSASDPYMDIEKDLQLTRDILNIFLKFKYPVHIITKSELILRDIDILDKINKVALLPDDLKEKLNSNVIISFSFSTIDDDIAKLIEPNAPLPSERLKTIKKLSKKGYKVGAVFMPILPYLSDDDEKLKIAICEFSKNNCDYVIPGALSLFGNGDLSSRIKYYKVIEEHYNEYLEDTKNLFWDKKSIINKEYPSNVYQNKLYKKVYDYCREFNISTTIVKNEKF